MNVWDKSVREWDASVVAAASGLRKVADIPRVCTSSAHDPPTMIVLPPGVYEYTCPACGETCTFTVARVTS